MPRAWTSPVWKFEGWSTSVQRLDLLKNLQLHRAMAHAALHGDQAVKDALASKRTEIEENLKALDEVDRRLTIGGKITEDIERRCALSVVDLLKKTPSLSEDESFARHSSAIAGLISLIARVGDVSNLTHNPDIDRKRLIDVLVFQGPELSESLSRARGFGLGVAESKTRTVEQVERLTRDAVLVEFLAAKLDESMAMALEANGAFRPELEGPRQCHERSVVLEAMAEVAKLTRGGTIGSRAGGVFHRADRERGLDLRARTAHRDVAHRDR